MKSTSLMPRTTPCGLKSLSVLHPPRYWNRIAGYTSKRRMRHPITVLSCSSDYSLTHRRLFYFVKISLKTAAMWIMPASNHHEEACYNVPSIATEDYPPASTSILVLSSETFTSSRLSALMPDIAISLDTTQNTIYTHNIFEF